MSPSHPQPSLPVLALTDPMEARRVHVSTNLVGVNHRWGPWLGLLYQDLLTFSITKLTLDLNGWLNVQILKDTEGLDKTQEMGLAGIASAAAIQLILPLCLKHCGSQP